ncbi:extra-cytoplasmic solute receptor [Rhodoplanes sp. Z2-YC6860]|nr:extra-cytoplasmic solute receptor [Rhodoplanes sp. Z2-YC6860]
MRMDMRQRTGFAAFCLAAVLSVNGEAPLAAETWPSRPITMVVPFAPGSSSDVSGRVLGAGLSEFLGQQVVIENVPGGGGMTGTARVAKAPPDGYQFVFASVDSMAIVPAMHKKPLYDSVADFAPVGLAVEQPIVLITRKDLPVNSMGEFAAYAKAHHNQMQFGSAGVGSGSHFSCARLNVALGVDTTHVPYRGSNLAIQDLIAGRIDYVCSLAAAAMGAIEGEQVKPIALLANEQSALFPGLKTAKEFGFPGMASNFWTAFFFPKGTPDGIVQKLSEATNRTLSSPVTVERLKKSGVTPVAPESRSPAYLTTFVGTEIESWAAQVKSSGVAIE